MFVDHHHVDWTVDAMKWTESLFVHVKLNILALHQIADPNAQLTPNVHLIKRAINLNAQILAVELVVSELVSWL